LHEKRRGKQQLCNSKAERRDKLDRTQTTARQLFGILVIMQFGEDILGTVSLKDSSAKTICFKKEALKRTYPSPAI
jgi:hypothetical protein